MIQFNVISHLRLGLLSGLFPSGFPTKTLCVFLFSSILRRDSSVGVATRYELDGQGIESRRGEIFRSRPDRPGAHPASYTMGTGSLS